MYYVFIYLFLYKNLPIFTTIWLCITSTYTDIYICMQLHIIYIPSVLQPCWGAWCGHWVWLHCSSWTPHTRGQLRSAGAFSILVSRYFLCEVKPLSGPRGWEQRGQAAGRGCRCRHGPLRGGSISGTQQIVRFYYEEQQHNFTPHSS